MFLGFLLMLGALAICAALTIGAIGAFAFAIVTLLVLKIKHRSEFWAVLSASICGAAGLGALLGSWGVSSLVSHLTPDWGWAVLAWICGFPLGALLGILFATTAVLVIRRRTLRDVWQEIKKYWQTARRKFGAPFRFSQIIEIGKWSWQCAFSLDPKNADEEQLKAVSSV